MSARQTFRQSLTAALRTLPFTTTAGGVVGETTLEFGYPAGNHAPSAGWLYERRGTKVRMAFGFVPNFTPDDLMVKVFDVDEPPGRGTGASVQFNGARCTSEQAGGVELRHHGSVTVSTSVSRERLADAIRQVAPGAAATFGLEAGADSWPVKLGDSTDWGALLDRVFEFAQAVEAAKALLRAGSDGALPRVFAKRVWGFSPATWPVVVFGRDGDRDALLRKARPGDRILLVATQREDAVEEENRGRLLGMVEFGRSPVRTSEVVAREDMRAPDLDEHGEVRWPFAIPMTRAWHFVDKPLLIDVLREQLPYSATNQAVLLDETDARAILALSCEEVPVPDVDVLRRAQRLNEALAPKGPTTGPMPTSSHYEVDRDVNRMASTYCFRFGKRDLWKIGHAVDVINRLAEVNSHVPSEVLGGEQWSLWLKHDWNDGPAAYAMEQRVLSVLSRFRTVGERVQCREAELKAGWTTALTSR